MQKKIVLLLLVLLTGCYSSSGIMVNSDGTYMISVKASPARGGTAGAHSLAYKEAVEYCETKGLGNALIVNADERDIYHQAEGVTFTWGAVNMRFRCQK